MYRIFRTIRRT